ncbi:MAG: hypothetical protein LLG15_00755 [Betaproteobacteria bacterium]|nr:hypothetical protein [Betaproteobacteria bacterium]
MKQLLRKFVLGFLLLWLPLQGFAASGMSFCRHDHTPPPAAQVEMHHGHNGDDCGHGQDTPSPSSQTQCDDCGYCYLGGAPALLPTLLGFNDTAGFSFKFTFDSHRSLFFPEQPQRPPLAHLS